MTDTESIDSIKAAFAATEVPYWRLKIAPDLDMLNGECEEKPDAQHQLMLYATDVKLRKYWERRARELGQQSVVTKNEIRNAIVGVGSNSELVEMLKQQLKRAQ